MFPIIKTLLRNGSGALLAALQVAVTLAVCTNALFIIKNRTDFINKDHGIDVDNVFIYNGRGYGDNFNYIETVESDLDWIRSLPGVVSVGYSHQIPLSGSGSSSGYRASADESSPQSSTAYFRVNEAFVNSLGLTIIEGRNFSLNDIRVPSRDGYDQPIASVIISRALAEDLFPNQSAVGKLVYNNSGSGSEVVGVVDIMPGPWVSAPFNDNTILLPSYLEGASFRYIIRTEPGQRQRIMTEVEQGLQERRRNVVQVNLESMTEIVASAYEESRAMVVVLKVSIVLVLLVTAFGLIGLASSSVRQRTKQIGTRRALGARKHDVLLYFVSENWLTTTTGILIGLVLTQWVNYIFVTEYELEPLDSTYILAGAIIIWLIGLLSVLGPALKAVSIPPALATRSV